MLVLALASAAAVACNGGPDSSDAAPADSAACGEAIEIVIAEYNACSAPAGVTATCSACTEPTVPLAQTLTCACYQLPDDCFVGNPPDDKAEVPARPGPDPACCTGKLSFDQDRLPRGIPATEPTLEVEVGAWDKCAQRFVPYQDRQWTELVMGSQGLFHVHASVRVHLPDVKTPFAHVQMVAAGLDGCTPIAQAFVGELRLDPDPEKSGWWVYKGNGGRRGVFVVFPKDVDGCQACRFCGHWLDLRVAVKHSTTEAWGESRRSMRTYLKGVAPECLKKGSTCEVGGKKGAP